jgi:hypothetical protein
MKLCTIGKIAAFSLFLGTSSLVAQEIPSSRPTYAPDHRRVPVKLSGIPVSPVKRNVNSIQAKAEYRVIDSLFNAYSFYGSEQQPLSYEPGTGLFAVIKRGALPATDAPGNPDNSNCLRLLISGNLGKTWDRPFSLHSGDINRGGLPRYPSVDVVVPEGGKVIDEAVFTFSAPLTKSNGTGTRERTWDGSVIGYQANDPTSSAAYDEVGEEAIVNGQPFWWGTECTTASFRSSSDDELITCYSVDLIPSDSGNTSPADVNSVGLFRKDFYESAVKPKLTVPAQWASNKFLSVSSASSRTRNHVGMNRDRAGNFYNASFGFFVANDDSTFRTFGVSKSGDHGKTWGEFNILPQSVFAAYARSLNCDPDSVFFDWSRSSTDPSAGIRLTSYAFISYGPDMYSCFTQFYVPESQPSSTHLVECYYNNGQWGIRKVADVSLFENANFWRAFDNDGSLSPTQMGNELQAAVTADENTIVCKFLEAKYVTFTNESGDKDTILSTDVVLSSRPKSGGQWSIVKNVTQSDIVDRTTWIPTLLPSDLKNIPLITVQTAEKGTTIREQLYESQMRLASSTVFDLYKQYLTVSNFNVADLPDWNGLTQVSVKDNDALALAIGLVASPNPANEELTVTFENSVGDAQVSLVNAIGQQVFTSSISEVGRVYKTLNTSVLPVGLYVLNIRTAQTSVAKTITIVR